MQPTVPRISVGLWAIAVAVKKIILFGLVRKIWRKYTSLSVPLTCYPIVNALGVSSDMVLTDVLETGYTVKNSMLNEKLEKLVPEDRNRIYEVIDTLVKQSKQILP